MQRRTRKRLEAMSGMINTLKGLSKRVLALALCVAMVLPLAMVVKTVQADNVSPDSDSQEYGLYIRQADPSTMDSYVQASLGGYVPTENGRVADGYIDATDANTSATVRNNYGSRYAGEVWTDKSVFALDTPSYLADGTTVNNNWDSGTNTLYLDNYTDGIETQIGLDPDSDFLHVFSTLGSSQQIVGDTPVDVVFVLDVSPSMGKGSFNIPGRNRASFGIGYDVDDEAINQALTDLDSALKDIELREELEKCLQTLIDGKWEEVKADYVGTDDSDTSWESVIVGGTSFTIKGLHNIVSAWQFDEAELRNCLHVKDDYVWRYQKDGKWTISRAMVECLTELISESEYANRNNTDTFKDAFYNGNDDLIPSELFGTDGQWDYWSIYCTDFIRTSYSKITQSIKAINESINTLMRINKYNRVGVVVFATHAAVMMELGRYEPVGANGEYIWLEDGYLSPYEQYFGDIYYVYTIRSSLIPGGYGGYSSEAEWREANQNSPRFKEIRTCGENYENGGPDSGAVALETNPDGSLNVDSGKVDIINAEGREWNLLGYYTNMDAGFWTGLSMLAEQPEEESKRGENDGIVIEDEDGKKTSHKPALVFLGDGDPNNMMGEADTPGDGNWWNPENPLTSSRSMTRGGSSAGNLDRPDIIAATIMRTALMKDVVDKHYKDAAYGNKEHLIKDGSAENTANISMELYTVGVVLGELTGTSGNQNIAKAILNPQDAFAEWNTAGSQGFESAKNAYLCWADWSTENETVSISHANGWEPEWYWDMENWDEDEKKTLGWREYGWQGDWEALDDDYLRQNGWTGGGWATMSDCLFVFNQFPLKIYTLIDTGGKETKGTGRYICMQVGSDGVRACDECTEGCMVVSTNESGEVIYKCGNEDKKGCNCIIITKDELTDSLKAENGVTVKDYTDAFVQADASRQILDKVESVVKWIAYPTWTPMSNTTENSAGVIGGSMTYTDPIGAYMTIDNVTDMTLFGERYTVEKYGVYEAKANITVDGWYDSDNMLSLQAEDPDSGNPLGDDASAAAAWEKGYTYRLTEQTVRRKGYIPTLDSSSDEKKQNTTYTIYTITGKYKNGVAVPLTDKDKELHNESYSDVVSTDVTDTTTDEFHIWVENTGKWRDTSTSDYIVNNDYSEALFIDIPLPALPLQVITVWMDTAGKVAKIENNLADTKWTTPLRVYYSVSFDKEYLLYETEDAKKNQVKSQAYGVDLEAIEAVGDGYLSDDHITTYKNSSYYYFLSNHFSGKEYEYPVADDFSTQHGNPNVTFTIGSDNQFYRFQKDRVIYLIPGTYGLNDRPADIALGDLSEVYEVGGKIYRKVTTTSADGTENTVYKDIQHEDDPAYDLEDEGRIEGVRPLDPTNFEDLLKVLNYVRVTANDGDPTPYWVFGDCVTVNGDTQLTMKSIHEMFEARVTGLTGDILAKVDANHKAFEAELEKDGLENQPTVNAENWYYIIREYYNIDYTRGGVPEVCYMAIPRKGSELGSGVSHGENDVGAYAGWYNPDKNDMEELDFSDTTGYGYPGAGYYLAVQKGGLRVGGLSNFIGTKGDTIRHVDMSGHTIETDKQKPGEAANPTGTALNFFLPTISQRTARSKVVVNTYLGNNGRILVMVPQVHKTETGPGDGKQVGFGMRVDYEVEWNNYLNEPATVTVRDRLDPGVYFYSAGFAGDNGDVVTLSFPQSKNEGTVSGGDAVTFASSNDDTKSDTVSDGNAALDGNTVEDPVPDGDTVEDSEPDQGTVEDLAPDQDAVEGSVPDEGIMEDPAPDQDTMEDPAPDQDTVEEPAPDQGAVENPTPDQDAVEDPVPDQGTVEDPAPDQDAMTDSVPDESIKPDAESGEETVLDAELAEDAGTDTVFGRAAGTKIVACIEAGINTVSGGDGGFSGDNGPGADDGLGGDNGSSADDGSDGDNEPNADDGSDGGNAPDADAGSDSDTVPNGDAGPDTVPGADAATYNTVSGGDGPTFGEPEKDKLGYNYNENTEILHIKGTVTLNNGEDGPMEVDVTITYDPESHTIVWVLENVPRLYEGKVSFSVIVNEDADYGWGPGDDELDRDVEDDRIFNRATVQIGDGPEMETNIVENPTKPYKEEPTPGNGKGVAVGDLITYTITWLNDAYEEGADGIVYLSSTVTIIDHLDPGVDFVEAGFESAVSWNEEAGRYEETDQSNCTAVYDGGSHTVTWTLPGRDAWETGVVYLTVRVNEKAQEDYYYDQGGNMVRGDGYDGRVVNMARVIVENGSDRFTNVVVNPVGLNVPDAPNGPDETYSVFVPKTGDDGSLGLWLALLALCLSGLLAASILYHKQNRYI